MYKIIKKSQINNSFKVQSVIGQFDLKEDKELVEEFVYDFQIPDKFRLGVIVGNSGTGKTTLAKELFEAIGETVFDEKAVIDCIDCPLSVITEMFTRVGFASPRSWLKPFSVLSNGEKMRVQLASQLLSGSGLVVFDEFTSVVDREVAKTMCMVMNKVIQSIDSKVVLVTCHFDVLNYLDTDWVVNTNDQTLFLGKKKDYIGSLQSRNVNDLNGDILASIII